MRLRERLSESVRRIFTHTLVLRVSGQSSNRRHERRPERRMLAIDTPTPLVAYIDRPVTCMSLSLVFLLYGQTARSVVGLAEP
jgi:hypothetical protein